MLAVCALLLAPLAGRAEIFSGKQVLFVMNVKEVADAKAEVPYRPDLVKLKEAVLDDDYKVVEHLKKLGFAVTTCDESGSVDLAQGKDLIIVSESVNANEIGAKYTNLATPVICWENDLYDDLHMTGKRLNVDYGSKRDKTTALEFYNAWHPLSAGVSAGVSDVYSEPRAINWGRPGLGAIVIATLPGEPDKATTFAYEKGATMDYDYVAPARRLALFLNQDVFHALNPTGLAQFDAALAWALEPPVVAPAPVAGAANGKKMLYVMNLHEAELVEHEIPVDAKRRKDQQQILAADQKIIEHFKSLGFAVTAVDEHPTSDAGPQDVIVISDSVNSHAIGTKYKNSKVPVVTWASELYGEMGFTGRKAGVDFGSTGTPGGKDGDRFASMVNGSHALNAGLATNIIQNLYDDNEYITNWGKPGPGATNIAVIPGYPDKRLIFAYETGASMEAGRLAPSRRVAFFLHTYDWNHMLPEGITLLDAAVTWAAGASK